MTVVIFRKLILLFLGVTSLGFGQTLKNTLWVTNGEVRAIAKSGHSIYLGGSFTQVGPSTGAGAVFSSTGTGVYDSGWPKVNGQIRAVIPDGAGGWYIGGDFTSVGGIARNRIARIFSNKTVSSWNPNANGSIATLALHGSHVYVGGDFSSIGGQTRNRIAAIRVSDGTAGPWNPNPNGSVLTIVAAQNLVYVGGNFSVIGGQIRNNVAAFDTASPTPSTFDANVNGPIHTIAVGINSLYLGGSFTAVGGRTRTNLASVSLAGGVQGYDPSPNGIVHVIRLIGNSILYVAGEFTSISGVGRNRLAAIGAFTPTALTWNPGADGAVHSMIISSADVFVGGQFTSIGGQSRNNIARLDTFGAISSWSPNAGGEVNALALTGTTVYAGGNFATVNTVARNNLAAFNDSLGTVTAWNPGITGGGVNALAISGLTLYAGGTFTTVGTQSRSGLAAISQSTALPSAWNPAPSDDVNAIAALGGRIYVGGTFTSVGGSARNRIAAIDSASGTAIGTWNPNANGDVYALAATGQSLYVGGAFTSIGANARNKIAAINLTSGTATSWNPNAGSVVSDVVRSLVSSNGTVYAGGSFSNIGGQPRNAVAAIDSATGTATSFDAGLQSGTLVDALAYAAGNLYVGGILTPGTTSDLISVNPISGISKTWDPKITGEVKAISISDTTVYAGGLFQRIGGELRPSIAGIVDPSLLIPVFNANPASLIFSSVLVGQSKTDSVLVANAGGGTLSITAVTSNNPRFTIQPQSGSIPEGTNKKFYVTFTPVGNGVFSGTISFGHNAPNSPSMISVSGNGIAPVFSVLPGTIAFGSVLVGTNKIDSLTVTNAGTAILNISSVTSTNVRFSVTPANAQIPISGSRKFYVTFSPGSVGAASSNIIFNHNGSAIPDSVRVSGTGTTPGFSIAPDSMGFGPVRVGTSKRDSVTVTNTGTSNLNISNVVCSDARFTVTPTNAQILPGGNRKFFVNFSPLNTEGYVASLEFTHDAGGLTSIPMTGEGAQPIFSVAPPSLTFGNVLLNTTKTDSLLVRNLGTWPLTIDSAVSSTARFIITPRTSQIGPGQTQSFLIRFTPTVLGNSAANIIFAHDAAGSPVQVVVAGTGVAPAITIVPDSLRFGNVIVNTSKIDSFAVINPGTSDLVVSSATSTNSSITVQPSSAVVPPLGSVRFRVTFVPPSLGAKSGSVIISHSAVGSPDTVVVSGFGVAAGFVVNPSSLSFGTVTAGSTRRDSITITNNGNALLNIDTVRSSQPRFLISPTSGEISPGTSQKFYVTFSPVTAETTSGAITFIHSAPGSPTQVAVSGTGVAPLFSISPASLNFDSVLVGATKPDSVTITNVGNASLNVVQVTSTNAQFSVEPQNAVIAPLASRRFYVRFLPDTVGTAQAEIVFSHNGAGSPVGYSVSGTGVISRFALSTQSKNFGNVVLNTTSTDSVRVSNGGTAALSISSVTSSINDFSVSPTFAVVPAGGNLWFKISFRPTSIGEKDASIVFTHNATGSPDTVNATGNGIQSTFSLSRSNIGFGNVKVGVTSRDSVRVTNTGNGAIVVSNVFTGDPRFAVSPQSATIQPGNSRTFTVSFTPDVRGPFVSMLTFIHNSEGSPTSISLAGNGLAPSFSQSRQSIAFGSVRVGFVKQDTITLANTGDDTLIVHQPESSDQRFAAVLPDSILLPQASKVVLINFTPDTLSIFEGLISFEHNAPGSPSYVAVSGVGSAPVLSAFPPTVSFGVVNVGDSSASLVQLVNIGTARMTVDSVRIRGRNSGEFRVAGSAGPFLPVAPLETLKVNVRFAPQSVDSQKSAKLFIYSDALTRVDSLGLNGRSRSSQVRVTLNGDTTAGSALRIAANPPEEFVPSRALLYYRVAGRRAYDSLVLAPNGSAFETTFPDSVMTIRGVEYYVVFSNSERRVTNPENDPANNPAIVQVKTLSTLAAQNFAARQYKMISIPLELGTTTAQGQLFDDYGTYNPIQWRLFRWEENRSIEFDSIEARFSPGIAFWLVTQSGNRYDADNGRSVRSGRPFSISLSPGWNQIASPFAFPIAWDSVGNRNLVRAPYYWDGSQYVPNVRQLSPWEGYFVLNDSDRAVTLTIPSFEVPRQVNKSADPIATSSGEEFLVRFSASSGSLHDDYNYVGMSSAASPGKDLLDLPEPPQIQDFVQLSFVANAENFLANLKPKNNEGHWWTMVVSSSLTQQDVRIEVEQIGNRPEDFEVFILDEDEFNTVRLDQNAFNIRTGARSSSRTFRIIIGTKDYAERMSNGIPLVPMEFTLHQNYPNPFNPSTTIAYSIGKRSDVRLEIFDVLGQLVKTLVSAEQLTGRYAIEFDGTNNSGSTLASGVYLYRLSAGEIVQTKKLLLLR